MHIQLLGKPTVVMENPHSKHCYFAWPSIARLQDGRIAAVSSGFRLAHLCPFGKAVIAYSDDQGKTFTSPAPVIDTPLDDRDAGITAFGETGVVVTSFNNTVEEQRAWNDDAYIRAYLDTITPQEEHRYHGAEFRFSHDCGKTFGRLYRSPVTSPHGITALRDGSLLWVGTEFGGSDICAYTVCPDGTMTKRGEIPHDGAAEYCEPHAIELQDGTLLCHIRAERDDLFTLYQSQSFDGGRTWTAMRRLLPDLGGAPAHLLEHSSGILLSAYGYRCAPYGVRVMFSADNAATWDTDHILYSEGADDDLGYPASVELDDGTILTVFYAHPHADAPAVILCQHWEIAAD